MTDKNDKKKAGLHKEISSIFDGVPVPSNQGMARPHLGPPGPQPGQAGYDSPRPVPRGPENPQIPGAPQQFRQAGRPGAPARARAGAAAKTADQGALRQVTKKLFGPKEGVSAKRQIFMAILVLILLVVFIIVLMKVFGASSSKKLPWSPKPKPKPTTTATVSLADTGIDWRMPEPYPAGLRDPMQLTAEMTAQIEAEAIAKTQAVATAQANVGPTEQQPDKPQQELAITGILFSQDNPTAVIGTRIAHVGDTIAGATIVKINLTTVEFEKDGKSWTQTLEP
jgi:hypothetical protein